jgi:hypothetical protein
VQFTFALFTVAKIEIFLETTKQICKK